LCNGQLGIYNTVYGNKAKKS